MESFSNQQLQMVIAQLDQAIYNHELWYKNLLRVMVLRLPPENIDLEPDAHHRCRFGQWYESSQAEFLHDKPSFISLGEAHKKMHNSTRIILQRIENDLPIKLEEWNQFDNDLENMRLEFRVLHHEFKEMAQSRDPLTEAQSRSSLFLELNEHYALVKRDKLECALAMIDLDHFKRINDEYGHPAGDAVLVAVVKCLKSLLRPYDQVYRYGGEEFIVCMPGISKEEAYKVVERMRAAIADLHIPFGNPPVDLQITVSAGLAMLKPSQSIEETIDCADRALYQAKNNGRNNVVVEDDRAVGNN